MTEKIQELIEISHFYGKKREYVIAGGGNTSYKDENHLYIKASGISLSKINADGFCVLDRDILVRIPDMDISNDPVLREEQVKNALLKARVNPGSGLRPSVETSLHNLFGYSFVVHTHPTIVNALMCSVSAESVTYRIFGNNVLFIPYSDPGFILFTEIRKRILEFREINGHDPKVVFIQNHGVFVAANTVEEIKDIYTDIDSVLRSELKYFPETSPIPVSPGLLLAAPAVRMILSSDQIKVLRAINNPMIGYFCENFHNFEMISKPFTPDQMVYCLSEYLFIENSQSSDAIIDEIRMKANDFNRRKGQMPKVIFIKGEGVIVADDSAMALDYLHDLVLDFCQIAQMSQSFGGPHPMTPPQVEFIENWEVENYRKKVSLGNNRRGRAENKIVLITGAAQGFGAGIAKLMFSEGANLAIADLNVEKGTEITDNLNSMSRMNKALFVQVDVADANSVKQMVDTTVAHFGGIDVFISNAGILRAGSLSEMTPETFDLMTQVNYNAYFYGTKYVSAMMKIQHQQHPGYFMDIIQINSKSGLKGSNKNFAYAGGKFGGIGLTQSFALELIPFNIKVNAICPGNFFDGPLWSDTENGLFVQYLKAGKIPGAKTVEDVKRYYEKQVPAGRGCTEADVVKAIYYTMEQEYETGQAIPVTGGQEMLS